MPLTAMVEPIQMRTSYPSSPSIDHDVDTPTTLPMTHADRDEVAYFLRESGWLARLQQDAFDRTVEDVTANVGLEVACIRHNHHPVVQMTVSVPERIGSDIARARKTLFQAFQATGWPVPRQKFVMRARRRALRITCVPDWDAP